MHETSQTNQHLYRNLQVFVNIHTHFLCHSCREKIRSSFFWNDFKQFVYLNVQSNSNTMKFGHTVHIILKCGMQIFWNIIMKYYNEILIPVVVVLICCLKNCLAKNQLCRTIIFSYWTMFPVRAVKALQLWLQLTEKHQSPGFWCTALP